MLGGRNIQTSEEISTLGFSFFFFACAESRRNRNYFVSPSEVYIMIVQMSTLKKKIKVRKVKRQNEFWKRKDFWKFSVINPFGSRFFRNIPCPRIGRFSLAERVLEEKRFLEERFQNKIFLQKFFLPGLYLFLCTPVAQSILFFKFRGYYG